MVVVVVAPESFKKLKKKKIGRVTWYSPPTRPFELRSQARRPDVPLTRNAAERPSALALHVVLSHTGEDLRLPRRLLSLRIKRLMQQLHEGERERRFQVPVRASAPFAAGERLPAPLLGRTFLELPGGSRRRR